MPTRTQLLARVRRAHTYDEMGEEFEIPAGQAYMIATGVPADGSDVVAREQQAGREGLLEGSTQHLVGEYQRRAGIDEKTGTEVISV